MAGSKSQCIYGLVRYFHTFSIGDGPSCTPTSMWGVSVFATELQFRALLNFCSSLFKILSFTAIFPSKTENIQETLSEERRLEGKVGFKTYKNYFRAGAHWSVIIFLILVNIATQVSKEICFWCVPLAWYAHTIYTVSIFNYYYVYEEIYFKKTGSWSCGIYLGESESRRAGLQAGTSGRSCSLKAEFLPPPGSFRLCSYSLRLTGWGLPHCWWLFLLKVTNYRYEPQSTKYTFTLLSRGVFD